MKNFNQLSLIVLAIISIMATSCVKDQVLDMKVKVEAPTSMENLVVEDPSIWNTLATQSITIDQSEETSAMLKSVKLKEYPSSDKYYFTLFEDLYPIKGDYDFNDIVIKSKLYLGKKGTTYFGNLNSELINKGGWLPQNIGVMFYRNSGKKYYRIPNEDIKVNGATLEGDEPYLMDIKEKWDVNFEFKCNGSVWISYFIVTEEGEIMTSGFAPSDVEEFKAPTAHFLTENNLPWGLEVEAANLAVVMENRNFLKAFPLFEEWAKSEGSKSKDWFKYPNLNFAEYK